MLSKKILIPVFSLVIVGASLVGGGYGFASAQSNNTPFSGLSEEIAQKFHLNQSDVQSVIISYMQQHKQIMMQNRQKRVKERLDQEVQAEKITSDQESAIIKELTSLKNNYTSSSFETMTPAQHQRAMQNRHNELEAWAKTQGIDPSLIPDFGDGRHHIWKISQSPTP